MKKIPIEIQNTSSFKSFFDYFEFVLKETLKTDLFAIYIKNEDSYYSDDIILPFTESNAHSSYIKYNENIYYILRNSSEFEILQPKVLLYSELEKTNNLNAIDILLHKYKYFDFNFQYIETGKFLDFILTQTFLNFHNDPNFYKIFIKDVKFSKNNLYNIGLISFLKRVFTDNELNKSSLFLDNFLSSSHAKKLTFDIKKSCIDSRTAIMFKFIDKLSDDYKKIYIRNFLSLYKDTELDAYQKILTYSFFGEKNLSDNKDLIDKINKSFNNVDEINYLNIDFIKESFSISKDYLLSVKNLFDIYKNIYKKSNFLPKSFYTVIVLNFNSINIHLKFSKTNDEFNFGITMIGNKSNKENLEKLFFLWENNIKEFIHSLIIENRRKSAQDDSIFLSEVILTDLSKKFLLKLREQELSSFLEKKDFLKVKGKI